MFFKKFIFHFILFKSVGKLFANEPVSVQNTTHPSTHRTGGGRTMTQRQSAPVGQRFANLEEDAGPEPMAVEPGQEASNQSQARDIEGMFLIGYS